MKQSVEVMLVDDEETFRRVASVELKRLGYAVRTVESGAEALCRIEEAPPHVVLVDLHMPEMDGMDLLRRIAARPEPPEILVVTGYPSVSTAIEAMKAGAFDYVTKPFQLEELAVLIDRAAERRHMKLENALLKSELAGRENYPEIIGQSEVVQRVLDVVTKVAASDATTLVQGESGTGKELIARAIHRRSARRANPFIIVDCCSLQENLLESELFGHEEGAYTGATRLKHGLFEVADGGTIFMDEIGEISLEIQAKLLRVLETASFRRLGSTRTIRVNVRLIAATNRFLHSMVEEGHFREDLYYRLNLVSVTVPPLRERAEDIEALVRHFMSSSPVPGADSKAITERAMALLRQYPWPGNIRELRNAIERALILSESDTLDVEDFSLTPRRRTVGAEEPAPWDVGEGLPTLEEVERRYVQKVHRAVDGHRRRMAEILGVSERGLYRKLKKLMP